MQPAHQPAASTNQHDKKNMLLRIDRIENDLWTWTLVSRIITLQRRSHIVSICVASDDRLNGSHCLATTVEGLEVMIEKSNSSWIKIIDIAGDQVEVWRTNKEDGMITRGLTVPIPCRDIYTSIGYHAPMPMMLLAANSVEVSFCSWFLWLSYFVVLVLDEDWKKIRSMMKPLLSLVL